MGRASTRAFSVALVACAFASCGESVRPSDAAIDDAADEPACVESPSGAPTDVFCTGLYVGRDPTVHSPDAIHYTPGLVLWSDGAEKDRYLSLPPGTVIDTTDMDAWVFPVGTRAWKEFRVDGVLVETRFLWKRSETSWVEATYIWDADGRSARLGDHVTPTILPSGYEIPATRTCALCHDGASDTLLGIEAITLGLAAAEGVTLTSLASAGSLSAPPPTTTIALPEDATGRAAAALGYVHVNCGMPCHSERGVSAYTHFFGRLRAEEFWPSPGGVLGTVETSDTYRTGVNAEVMIATYSSAFPGTQLITPGAHATSLVWVLPHRRGLRQMPPVVSHVVDDVGTQAIADWIDALPR